MNRLILPLSLLAITPVLVGCKGVTTHTYTRLPNAITRCFKENDKYWVELKIDNLSQSDPWQIKFENDTPKGLKVLTDTSSTRFLWIASQERVKFFGNNGYKLKIKNSKQAYDLLITLKPNYSVVLEFLLSGLAH